MQLVELSLGELNEIAFALEAYREENKESPQWDEDTEKDWQNALKKVDNAYTAEVDVICKEVRSDTFDFHGFIYDILNGQSLRVYLH